MPPRKTSTLPTRNWTFSARIASPMESAIGVLISANRYYNTLVAIERRRHLRYTEIRKQHAPELAAIDEEWQALDEQIRDLYREAKAERQAHWRRSGGERSRMLPPAFEERKARLVERQKAVSVSSKEHRAAFAALVEPARAEYKRRATERAAGRGPRTKSLINAAVLAEMLSEPTWHTAWKQIATSDKIAHMESLSAREQCGLYAGTYLAIEEAFARAKQDSAPLPPRFRRFDGEGKIAVQIKSTWAEINGPRLRIEPLDRRPTASARANMVRVILDQSRDGSPSIIEATAKLHRMPPADAAVKWAALLFRRVGRDTIVRFQLTLEHPSFGVSTRPEGCRTAEHICLGWSRIDGGGVRVAYWPGGGEVVCSAAILSQHESAASIESIRDRMANEAVRRFRAVTWLSGHRFVHWDRASSDKWRSTLRRMCVEYARHVLGGVADRWMVWRNDRKSRGEDLYAPVRVLRQAMTPLDALAWWAYLWAQKDRHLEQYAAHARRRFMHRRDAHYRHEAIRLATEFKAVTIDKFSIAELKKLEPLTMPGTGVRDAAQSQLHAAAPGRFREILLEVMGPRATACERPRDAGEVLRARKRKHYDLARI